MPKNYLIGIGGTGARIVEAVVHCCASGFGPEELNVFLVDPDQANGNVARTTSLLARYEKCQRALTERSRPSVRLFGTRIRKPDPVTWTIFEDQNMTLGSFLNLEGLKRSHVQAADYLSLLFAPEELETPLNEGFRGHPSIGATVMSDIDPTKNPWKMLWDDVQTANKPNDVRVFLAGSVFGGTGAAGVPTFGAESVLKFNDAATLDRQKGLSRILLGAGLVLPYFTIEMDSAPSVDEAAMHVTASDFPIATRAALEYYNEKKLAFDQLYFIGDSIGQKVGKFSPGSATQKNRPHYVELVAALAAFDFFDQNEVVQDSRDSKMYFGSARPRGVVDWQALPVSRDVTQLDRKRAELKLKLATMTAFAYAFGTLGQEVRSERHEAVKDSWYNDHFKFSSAESSVQDPRQWASVLDDYQAYAHEFLLWITALDDDDGNTDLIDRRKLLREMADGTLELVPYQTSPASIGSFLKNHAGNADFNAFRGKLNELRIDRRSMTAPDKYVNLFYDASYEFCKANYRITMPATGE